MPIHLKSVSTIRFFIISWLALFLMQGCASNTADTGSPVYYQSDTNQNTRSAATIVSDTVLKARVNSKFRSDDMVDGEDIQVTVRHGVVYLDGRVVDAYQRRMARDLVSCIDGVVRVVNRLSIGSQGQDL